VVEGQAKEAKKKDIMISYKGVKKLMLAHKSVFVAYFSGFSPSIHSLTSSCALDLSLVLYEFQDGFQDPPKGLQPLKGIEHQIDFIQGFSLPNRPAYRTNPEESKEIKKQTGMEKGWVQHSTSPYVMPVILVP